MSRLAYFLATGVLPGTVGLAVAGGGLAPKAPQFSASTEIHCEIRAMKVPGGVELRAIASGVHALNGSYSFVIEKNGSSGESRIAQAGEFSLQQGTEQVVGTAGLAFADGGSYDARLVLTSASGELACAAHNPG